MESGLTPAQGRLTASRGFAPYSAADPALGEVSAQFAAWPSAAAPPAAAWAEQTTDTGALTALMVGRQALAHSAERPLAGLTRPELCRERLHRAETLVRATPHAPANTLWCLPERLRLIELTLSGADRPDHQPSWQRAEFDLLLAVGRCAQAHAIWQDAAEDFVLLVSLVTRATAWDVTDCGMGPWVELRRAQMAKLRKALELARDHLEASTQRFSTESVAAKTLKISIQ